ncbi:hypothetical protein [Streptomyces sp. NPDC055107]
MRSAAVATVSEAWTRSPLVVLMSDGVHQVPHGAMEALALRYEDDPQALSEALVAAASPGADGVRDGATALVIRRG